MHFFSLFGKIRKNIWHFMLPISLLILSHFNEKYYLQENCDTLMPLYFIKGAVFVFGFWMSIVFENGIKTFKKSKETYGKIILNEKQKSFIIIMSWFLFWYGVWLAVYYPCSHTPDTLDAIRQISYMKINDWFSFLHPLTYLFLYQFYPDIITIGIAQIFLCSFVFADITSYFYANLNVKKTYKNVPKNTILVKFF